MLTVLIETSDDEEPLARTLGALVPAAVEGMVREVMVVDRGSRDHTRAVADHAGCIVVADGFAAAVGRAKADWLLLLEPGARPLPGWTEAVAAHVAGAATPARFALAAGARNRWLSRLPGLVPGLLRGLARPGAGGLSSGLLVTRREALAAGCADGAALARRLSPRRLDGLLVPAPPRR